MNVTGSIHRDGHLTLARVSSSAVRAGILGLTADRIGRKCVSGIPCTRTAGGRPKRYFIEPGFPHVDLRGQVGTLRPRCWRLLLYHCARHDGTRYILPDPIIIGPTKVAPDFPVARPYVSCCWDYSGSKRIDFTSRAAGGGVPTRPADATAPLYFGRATRDGLNASLTGERLIEIIAEAWTDCGCTFAAFLDQVPADCPHDLMMVQIVYVIRRADKATGGQPEYVDTEVRDIYVDRCDPTPAGS